MITQAIFADASARFSGSRRPEDMFSDITFDANLAKTYAQIAKVEDKIGSPFFIIFEEDEEYPTALKSLENKDRPGGFIAIGNRALLGRPMVGICGSRKASERGLALTHELCSDLARKNAVVVSGYAAGVDEAAHKSALAVGGNTICVLAEGILHFRIRQSLRDVWDWQRTLVLSQFGFDQIWKAGRAMQRNKTIVGMSQATVVVEARDSGGTLDAGLSALRLRRPLFVADYAESGEETAGNKRLLGQGGLPLRRSKTTGGPATSAIEEALFSMHS